MLDWSDLDRYIKDNLIAAEIVRLTVPTPTVEAAATAVGVAPEQIGKSLLFLADGRPVLVISNGTSRVSYKALADFLGINRRDLRMANVGEVAKITGYPVGTVPPFGHPGPLQTLLDAAVMNQEALYAGGGAIDALMRINTAELLRVTRAELVEL